MDSIILILPLFLGWFLDMIFGDPIWLPHPVVAFGKSISFCEHTFNKGSHQKLAGGLVAVILIVSVFFITWWIIKISSVNIWLECIVRTILIFYCLAGTTLIKEVREVFKATDRSLDEGRHQVARIVGRDTGNLSLNEIRTAALETLAENLSDGVVAPLFWYVILGVPGMVAYKMVNTLDSMIGYKNERYRNFGMVAARIDDFANYIPARITAFLMIIVSGKLKRISFVRRFGSCHSSPNSGYPEAALAAILDGRFGGTHDYFGESVYKPYIGENQREFNILDADIAIAINRKVEIVMILMAAGLRLLFQ